MFIQMLVPFSVALVRSMMILLNAANALQDSPSMSTNVSVSAILTVEILFKYEHYRMYMVVIQSVVITHFNNFFLH